MPMRFFATVNARLDLNAATTITDLMLPFYVQRIFFFGVDCTPRNTDVFFVKMSENKAISLASKSAKNNRNFQCDFSGVYPYLWR
jgi:hypothetical protein